MADTNGFETKRRKAAPSLKDKRRRRRYEKRMYKTDPRWRAKKLTLTRRERAKKQGRPWQLSFGDEMRLQEIFKRCPYCGKKTPRTLDHIDHNGDSGRLNLLPCCKSCNPAKGEREATSWLSERARDPVKIFCGVVEKLLRADYFTEDEAVRFLKQIFPDAEPTIGLRRNGLPKVTLTN